MSNSLISNAIYLDDIPKSQWRQNYIGPGYRSACYKIDADRQGKIILFGFDPAGNPKTFVLPWDSHVKYAVKYETGEKDIYDRWVATKTFRNIFERKKWVEAANGITIVECLRPEQEVLHFLFDNDVLADDFNKQTLRIQYFDIETEISDQFERPADARNRINMMTIYDSLTEKFYTWSLQHAEIDFKEEPLCHYPKDKFVFFEFNDNETKLLEHFLDWYECNYPDVNFGWNTRAYDWPYVVRRIENVLGKAEAQRLSPVSKYYIKEVNHDNKRADVSAEIEVSIDGLFIADGLALYRDKFGISKPDGGFTLDNIGEVEGCGHKIKYDGTLKDLYLKDYQKFYEYNVRDVDLAKRIEDKCKMIPLARTITSFGLSQYPTIYSSISYLVGSVIAFAKTEMGKVMCSYVGEKKHFDGFEGAFVFPTQKGVYRKGVGVIDFASLYPSLIQALNASPETYRGKVLVHYRDASGALLPVNEVDDLYFDIFDDNVAKAPNVAGFSLKYPDGRRQSISLEKLRSWIEKHGIYTANNTIFLKHEEKWGVIAKWCEYFYGQRKATKKKMLAIFHELHDPNLKFTAEEIAVKETQRENFDSRQGAMKNMINSIYGQMGSAFSPIANLDIAQSITRMGRYCNTNASIFVVKRFQECYDKNFKGFRIKALAEDARHWDKAPWINVAGLAGDTDSTSFAANLRIKQNNVDKTVQIGQLYDDILSDNTVPYVHGDGYEVIDCDGIEIASSTEDGAKTKYVKLLKLSRHKTTKNLVKISVNSESGEKTDVTVTTDHVCMRYDRDRVLENVKAKDLRVGGYVSLFSGALGWIDKIEDLGPTADYVYDCEVDDSLHAFYANDILVHNSQFIDLYPVTDSLIKKYSLPEKIAEWPQEKRQELWDIVSKFTDTEINAFVRKAVHENFHTNMQDRLTYELEYMVDVGIYESQKHYFVHKIFEEGDAVDKIKVTGISLKKNETDKSMKSYLKDIYEGVVVHDWTEKDYESYVNKLYDEFKKFSIDQISFWKGYGTECHSVGFMQMAKGATQISRACTYYNQLIEKLGLGKKYDQLRVGDKCRFTYLKPGNKYGINCIAYKPGQWPKEFDGIFEVDYSLMFDKIIRDQLKRFREACNFEDCDPRKQVVQDVFDL